MTDSEISKLVLEEFETKTFGTTESYLEIHEPIYENGAIRIDRIDREKGDCIIAYIPVKGEYFSFAVYIDPNASEIISVETEPRNSVSLIVTSDTMTSLELQQHTSIKCQEFWNKGDNNPHSITPYSFSGIEFHLFEEPDELADKLLKLLNYIETDKSGILSLSLKTEAYIKIVIDYHRGNQLLGSFSLKKEILKRITELNLNLDFQITAWGNGFK